MDEVFPVTPDEEKARSILKMVELRHEMIAGADRVKFASPLLEQHYEMLKELATALMNLDGLKTLGHVGLLEHLRRNYSGELGEADLEFLNELRRLRNKIAYEGYFVNPDFLDRNLARMESLFRKMIGLLRKKIPDK